MATDNPTLGSATIQRRARELFDASRRITCERTDRLFAALMLVQWVGGIITALVVSPRTWAGTISATHLHVLAAIFLGGAIAVLPIAMAFLLPGKPITRHTIAVGQMLSSALLIHLSGGRIETHFHIFGSLAFLAFYRDWRVLITASVVVAVDHLWRGIFWPQSVFGVLTASPWRVFEHAAWVVFEDIFLIYSIGVSLNQSRENAQRQARLEATSAASVEAVSNVRATADAVASSSQALNATASQLSSDANQQSSSVSQTTRSVEQIAEAIAQSANRALETDEIAQACAAKAAQGGKAVQDTIAAMQQIAKRISSVEEIAQNTDLLALNAEVQAARVGELGRGFAVVAMEIRKLAEVSRSVVYEINQLTDQSVDVAERAGKLLDEIVPSVQQTATLVQGIARSSAQQDNSLAKMKAAMTHLQDTSRRNADTSHLLSKTAGDMRSHVEQLQRSMVTLDADGAASHTPGSVPQNPVARPM
jgi:methyl-accepting chemotaxis protein